MKSWKKRWKDELERIVPEMRADVRLSRHCGEAQENGGGTLAKKRFSVPLISAIALLLAVVIAVCAVVFAPKNKGQGFFFTVEINPAVAFVADTKGRVTGVKSLNRDADILLSDGALEEELTGKELSECVTLYVDRAARLGFLDLNATGGAVRVSGGSESAKLLDGVQRTAQAYFCEKGVYGVVLTESVSVEELARRGGLPYADGLNVQRLASIAAERDTLFYECGAGNMEIERLQSVYRANVLNDAFAKLVGRNIKENLALIEEHGTALEELRALADAVYGHVDNPATILKDYWNVSKFYGNKLSGEFKTLVEETGAALARYEAKYGVAIENELDLLAREKKYLASLAISDLAALADNLTAELMNLYGEVLSAFTELTGAAGSIVSELMRLPQTAGEFLQKMGAAFSAECNLRAEQFKESYGAHREPLSERTYSEYVKGVVEQFGSLENFWQSKN